MTQQDNTQMNYKKFGKTTLTTKSEERTSQATGRTLEVRPKHPHNN